MQLVSAVVPGQELDVTVEGIVTDLLLGDSAAISVTRRLIRQLCGPTLIDRLQAAHAAAQVANDDHESSPR
jgi:hypothetical protein